MATFDPAHGPMFLFLALCLLANIWFVAVGVKRVRMGGFTGTNAADKPEHRTGTNLVRLRIALLCMALMDTPWVLFCTVQCFGNAVLARPAFSQLLGDESPGCIFMGFYSTFSLVSMMGSNCLVNAFAGQVLRGEPTKDQVLRGEPTKDQVRPAAGSCVHSNTFVVVLFFAVLLPFAIIFASIPLATGGYALTTGGFCYANWTIPVQSTFILIVTSVFLVAGCVLFFRNSVAHGSFLAFAPHCALFVITWSLWVVAAVYGITQEAEIAAPFMIIGGIVGHGQALLNPVLYGRLLLRTLETKVARRGESIACVEVGV